MNKVNAIKFRMYHTGSVGDCLLLLFMKDKKVSLSMLIDCGGWLTSAAAISACVKDIRETCNGTLDLLVVTHQHMDHISGFNQARAEFDAIHVKEVWLSWIEDEGDDVAQVLKVRYGKRLKEAKGISDKALKAVKKQQGVPTSVRGMGKRLKEKQLSIEHTLALIAFEEGMMGADGKLSVRPTNDTAMKYVKDKGDRIHYWKPGKVIDDLEGAEGMKFYILGPPRDEDMRYFKIDENEEEMYARMRAKATETVLEHIIDTGMVLEEGVSPFSKAYQLDGGLKFSDDQEKADYAWRGIESDWLETAASIALRATRLTNNTSLAMAIEFADSGRVILLPGDAQSGNWMGWHKDEVMKSLKKAGGKNTVELLENTVFYKVGHHGSHNGTASVSGLDWVKHKDLVAFMPLVQEKVPPEWGGSKNFPAKKLNSVLIQKTRGRLVRTDVGLVKEAKAVLERKKLSTSERNAFNKSFEEGENWVGYTVKG